MAAITVEQTVDVRRMVTVVFDHDNRPQTEYNGKVYSVISAQLEYRLRSGKWQNPWDITIARSQRVRDGSWGKEIWATEFRDRALIAELSDEYRPTATITVTEEGN